MRMGKCLPTLLSLFIGLCSIPALATLDNCPDLTSDDYVNIFDFAALADNWQATGTGLAGDFNGNNTVDIADLGYMANYWLTDPGCSDYYADALPYLTSFESYQGYTTDPCNINSQKGWNVLDGIGDIGMSYWWVEALEQYAPYRYLYIESYSDVVKEFDDEEGDHSYIRFQVVPGEEAEIRLLNESDIVMAVKFGADPNIYVWDEPNTVYANSLVAYDDKITQNGRIWTELELRVNWANGTYSVYWDEEPNAVSTQLFDETIYSTITHVEFYTQDDWFAVNRMSISGHSSPDLDVEIDRPCHCEVNEGGISQSRVPVIGSIWWDRLGLYQIMYCPWDLNPEVGDNWSVADIGYNIVESEGLLGHWDTGSIPNGMYYFAIRPYNDLAYSENIFIQTDQDDNYVPLVVTGDLKCNTFYHVEEPDISVNWPGLFPFELRRIYDNNRRIYHKPMQRGWTHTGQMTVREDVRFYCESTANGPFSDYAYHDNNMLAFGYVYVTYPDGSKHMFRRSSSGDTYNSTAEYSPYPENGKSERLVRRTYVDGYNEIYQIEYTLTMRDGTEVVFTDTDISIDVSYATYGITGWVSTAVVESMADRFGNTLYYSWNGDRNAVSEIRYGSGATARKIKFYFDNEGDYYTEARLILGTDEDNSYRTVTFDWDSTNSIYTVQHLNPGVDPCGVYQEDPNAVSLIADYHYDTQHNLVEIDRNGNPAIEIDYDQWGRVSQRNDYVDPCTYQTTTYSYTFYAPDSSDFRQEDSEADEEDPRYLKTTEDNGYVTTVTYQSDQGAFLAQDVFTTDNSSAVNVENDYNDTNHPLRPTQVDESFDNRTRHSTKSYNAYGDVITQSVYEDANDAIYYTDFDYHPDYSLVIRKTEWQGSNRSGQRVETLYIYGDADGTVDTDDGKYLVQEKVLLAEDPNVWAITSYKYTTSGLLSEKIDPCNVRTVYEYDSSGYKQWVKLGPSGSEEAIQRFYHDAVGQMVLGANSRGGVTRNDYDGHGRVWRVRTYEDASAMSTGITFTPTRYDSFTPLSTTLYGYDRQGNQAYVQQPAGGETVTVYNTANLPETITYDDGSYLEYEYNSRGLKTQEGKIDNTSSQDYYITYAYDAMGRSTDTYWFDYDDTSCVKHVENGYYGPGWKAWEKVYNGSHLESYVTYQYDLFGRVIEQVTDPEDLAMTVSYGYDGLGNRISITDPCGAVTEFDYDHANRQIASYFNDDPCHVKQSISYYNNNRVAAVTSYDTDGTTVLAHKTIEYDHRGRVTQVTEDIDASNTAVTSYDYSDTGWAGYIDYCVRITDAENQVTYIAKDAFGRTIQTLYPSGDYEHVTYNGDGTLATRTVFNSNGDPCAILCDYDDYARLAEITYPDDGGTISYTYDGFGRTTLVEDDRAATDQIGGSGEIAYQYDVLDRTVSVTDQDGYEIAYGYRADGQKISITVYDAVSPYDVIYNVNYTYNDLSQLTLVNDEEAGFNGFFAAMNYDGKGNRNQLSYYPSGSLLGTPISVDYTFNDENQLTAYTTSNGPTFSLASTTIDGLGRLTAGTETVTKTNDTTLTHVLSYGYDRRSQLTSSSMTNINGTTWTGSYAYNDDGNISSKQISGTATNYSYNNDLMSSATGGDAFSLTWDDNGNMTVGPIANFVYNWDNKLRCATEIADPCNSIAVKYDPSGNRIWKRSSDASSSTYRKYIVDTVGDLPVILMELDPCDSDAIAKTYVYAHSQPLVQFDGDMDDSKYFYLHDRLGNVRALIDIAGDVQNRYTYEPYGNDLATETEETVANPFKFTGQFFDSEIAQYYLRARQYDIYAARFSTRDPVVGQFREPLTLHRYLYCLNDPINKIDPKGKFLGGIMSAGMDLAMRGKDAALGAWARFKALEAIKKGAIISNALLSGTMNSLFGPKNVNEATLFGIGALAGGLEAFIAFDVKTNPAVANAIGSAVQNTLNEAASSDDFFSWATMYNVGKKVAISTALSLGLSTKAGQLLSDWERFGVVIDVNLLESMFTVIGKYRAREYDTYRGPWWCPLP